MIVEHIILFRQNILRWTNIWMRYGNYKSQPTVMTRNCLVAHCVQGLIVKHLPHTSFLLHRSETDCTFTNLGNALPFKPIFPILSLSLSCVSSVPQMLFPVLSAGLFFRINSFLFGSLISTLPPRAMSHNKKRGLFPSSLKLSIYM